ncbi:type I polyketide synthase [Allokutzneria albata]|uniref:Phthiocerol/phenolphthiocerol synthesis type-I polyketide synthase D n=1 Tax=Allokutzneria albata TaxID=211114 RepID=A0A1G9S781_ALLAB|nr:type I polyketide synthase [Allokutzneria albata]SDM31339.1 phthiocerol/phenolphthiocerol synthesis type-I polyketide synthase D [Allokutzneria albata]
MNQRELSAWLTGRVADLVGLTTERVDPDRPFQEYGLSSREALQLVGELEDLLEQPLSATLLWDHASITAVSAAVTAEPLAEVAEEEIGEPAGEPIAVVGVGCRLPGGLSGPDEFWRALAGGTDAVGEIPPDRWSSFVSGSPRELDALARIPRAAGVLEDITGFDAEFFSISPDEAAAMDPQQRLLLETAWEALEHAAISPEGLRGSRTGVFVGVSGTDYGQLTLSDIACVDAWTGTGAALSITANRLSYALDLRGPSMAVDTACSSSLVSVHMAVRSLRDGESTLALAGGVNLLLGPGVTANFARMGILSPSGRCAAFDADADGIVRGEGAGVVVLKLLSDAVRDRDRVLAVIRGSAVNQDGRSNGLTAPNPQAQQDLVRAACVDAGVSPAQVDYVEAHGTGTPLGDPIEAKALGAVYGAGRCADRPLLLGSVKTNLGHLEAAAGVAGLIKVVLALRNKTIPASLHHRRPNPHIPFAELGLAVTARSTAWPSVGRPSIAAVSAFGFGGTNAHVVLEQAAESQPRSRSRPVHEHLITAASEQRLREQAGVLADWIAGPGAATRQEDIATTLCRRAAGSARVAVAARDHADLVSELRAVARGSTVSSLSPKDSVPSGLVWVFPGQGGQWAGMGQQLLADEPAFTEAVAELDPLFRNHAGFSLLEEISTGASQNSIDRVQPVLFGLQVALGRFHLAEGVRPAAVIGHSFGEVAAAVIAGAVPVDQGLRIVTERSRLLATISGVGAMAVLGLSAQEVLRLAEDRPGIEAAVFNAPAQTVAVGPTDEVAALVDRVASDGALARMIKVDVAAHSSMVEPLTDPLRTVLGDMTVSEPRIPFYTTVLDDPRERPTFAADYWAANLREPVRFTQAVLAALEDGLSAFLEISAHPTLTTAITETAEHAGRFQVLVASSLSRAADETVALRGQLARLRLAGVADQAENLGEVCDLPGTVWRHTSHWIGTSRPAHVDSGEHPLLGKRIELPDDDRQVWQSDLGLARLPWLADHRAGGHPLLPTTGYVEMALNAASIALRAPVERIALRELVLREPLLLTEHVAVTTVFRDAQVEIHSRTAQGRWTCHATVRAEPAEGSPKSGPRPLGTGVPVEPAEVYARLRRAGQWHGPAFAGIQSVTRTDNDVVAMVELPSLAGRHPLFLVHPALLDSCLQVLGAALEADDDNDFYLPMSVGRVRVHELPGESVVCRIRLEGAPGDAGRTGSARLLAHDGRPLVDVDDLFVRRIRRWEVPASVAAHLTEVAWVPFPTSESTVDASAVLLVSEDPSSPRHAEVVAALRAGGHRVTELSMRAVLDDPSVVSGQLAPQVVLAATGDAEPGCPRRAERLVLGAVTVTPAIAEERIRLWLLTFDAASVNGTARDPGPAALRGLVRVLAYEHPEMSATWLDLPSDSAATNLVTELAADAPDDEVAWRDGKRYAARLRQVSGLDRASWQPPVRSDGGYVVTGGLGGLGLTIARWLADNGAAKVVLNGRSAPTPVVEAVLDAMRGDGVLVEVITGDLAEPGTAERLLAAAGSGSVPRGVVHAAAVMEPELTARLDIGKLDRVWSPKATGGWLLHRATEAVELDWWLGFSSLSALIGWPGEPAYAAANAYLDALAGWRHGKGLPGATVQWGAWAEVGKAAELTLTAVEPITPAEGLGSLGALACSGRTSTGVMKLDFDALLAAHPELRSVPFFSEMGARGPNSASGALWTGVASLPTDPDRAARMVFSQLHQRVAGLMGVATEHLSPAVALVSAGLDSLLAIRVRNAVQHDFGVAPAISRLLRGATLADLNALVADQLGLPVPQEAAPTSPTGALVPPRDDAERMVAALWEEVLATRCGVTTPFPGDAAQREALATLMAQRCGLVLDAEVTTIQETAALVREHNGSHDTVRVLRQGSGNPVFFFHPGGGDSWVYRRLVGLLDPAVPAFGFDRVDGVTSIADRAEHYVEHVLRLRPTGPYRLVGWSFGGFLAYEVADRLEALGHEVGLVAMIDSINPIGPKTGMDEPDLRHLAETLGTIYGEPISLPYREMLASDDVSQAAMLAQAITDAGVVAPEVAPAILHSQRTFHIEALAVKRYQPPRRAGRAVLYRATQAPPAGAPYRWFDRADSALGWDEFCDALEVVPVDGHHFAMLDSPHVETIAHHLRRTTR